MKTIRIRSYGVSVIEEERARQIAREGYTAKRDATHSHGQLALAGSCYIYDYLGQFPSSAYYHNQARNFWPFEMKNFKPTPENQIKQLTKAGALIAAEIDRLYRLNTGRNTPA